MNVVRLSFVALFLCSWGLIGTTSGSVSTEIGYYEADQTEMPDNEVVQEETVEQKITANLMVNDMEKTIAFYRDVLGFEIAMNQPEEPPYVWTMMQREGSAIMFQTMASLEEDDLGLFKGMETGGSFLLFIVVDDVKKINDAVQGKAEIVRELTKQFYGMLELAIKDPDGYVLVFAQPVEE